MGQRQRTGQVDPERCVHCLSLSLTQVHCPTEDSARIVLTHDSPGVGAACPDHCKRVVEGRVGRSTRLLAHGITGRGMWVVVLQACPGNLVIAIWGT